MRLSWAFVHSRQPEDVNRGIAMLEASTDSSNSPLQMREKLYLFAVGHYRNGDSSRSRQLLERCLEAQSLKNAVEDRIAKDGVIGIGIAATAVGGFWLVELLQLLGRNETIHENKCVADSFTLILPVTNLYMFS